MTKTPDAPGAGHNSGPIHTGKLKSFVERIERLEAEKRELGDDIKEVFAEAKGAGFKGRDVSLFDHFLPGGGLASIRDGAAAMGRSPRARGVLEGVADSSFVKALGVGIGPAIKGYLAFGDEKRDDKTPRTDLLPKVGQFESVEQTYRRITEASIKSTGAEKDPTEEIKVSIFSILEVMREINKRVAEVKPGVV